MWFSCATFYQNCLKIGTEDRGGLCGTFTMPSCPSPVTEEVFMQRGRLLFVLVLSCIMGPASLWPQNARASLGLFEDHSDVGTVLHAGSVDYDPPKRTYTISGSGENMWFSADAFHFAWKKISGDVT